MIVEIERGGKKYKAQVPDHSHPDTWKYGIVVGPPDLSGLGLPPNVEVRLHNELYNRGLIQYKDVRKKAHDVQGALQSALGLDAGRIIQAYLESIGDKI